MKRVIANSAHEVVYAELAALMNKHAEQLSAIDILAIAANMVGKLIALQDQRSVTPEMAMEIVGRNIELGNAQVVGMLAQTQGSA